MSNACLIPSFRLITPLFPEVSVVRSELFASQGHYPGRESFSRAWEEGDPPNTRPPRHPPRIGGRGFKFTLPENAVQEVNLIARLGCKCMGEKAHRSPKIYTRERRKTYGEMEH